MASSFAQGPHNAGEDCRRSIQPATEHKSQTQDTGSGADKAARENLYRQMMKEAYGGSSGFRKWEK